METSKSDLKIPHAELSGRLQKLMFLRVLFVSLLLGASVFLQVKDTKTYFGDIQTAHYALIAAIYFLTVIYILLLKTVKDVVGLAYFQLLMDIVVVTAVIYATGGIESIFSFLYILTIINGSIMLYRRGGMIVASFSSILYGLLLDLHFYGMIQPIGSPLGFSGVYRSTYIFYMITVNAAAFYLVAFLSSFVSEQARRSRAELSEKQHDLVQLEALNEWIIRSITSGLITLDREGRIILFNPAAETIFAVRAAGVIGRTLVEALPALGSRLGAEGPSRLIGSSARRLFDLHYARSDGKMVFLRCSMSPLTLPEGERKGEILLLQDLTELKQIEEEMKKVEGLALIGELAAGIAHEVRNPLASISGSIQMLKEDLGRSEMSGQLMDIILREIGRLNNLVSDFLLFARPKRAKNEHFDLNQLILDSLAIFKGREEWMSRIRVETDFPNSLMLWSDPEQLRQVLWNLFLNACEAMPEGGLLQVKTEKRVSKSPGEGQSEVVKITIRDTGEGFSQKALDQIFTPFFTTKEGGTGLGLAVVKRIVEGLKGKVSGQNHAKGGAEITLLLPSTPPA
ncbi:MAG: PAS domain S-box protein [Desulfobacteraceae bacterium]|nr:MAG: PAS domain S-box protein [Desulfobacteraceae bacterium]